jgi:hypothetical protein
LLVRIININKNARCEHKNKKMKAQVIVKHYFVYSALHVSA